MRAIINYIRQCFCKHDFKLIKEAYIYSDFGGDMPIGCRRVYHCKKCGYVQKMKIV